MKEIPSPRCSKGAIALKGMALTASGADAILAPYTDVHDVYHRVKRERHSFEPHYNKSMASVADGHAGPWRDAIQSDLAEGLALAGALRAETPLMRYLKRVLTEIDPRNDIVIVLRHPEDAQQASDRLLDFLTEPGSFITGIPELRSHDARTLYVRSATQKADRRYLGSVNGYWGAEFYRRLLLSLAVQASRRGPRRLDVEPRARCRGCR